MTQQQELKRFEKTAAQAVAGELLGAHVEKAVAMLGALSTQCADPKIRESASNKVIELYEKWRSDFYGGAPGAIQWLIQFPLAQRRDQAVVLWGDKHLTRSELEYVLKIIDSELARENERLTKLIEGDHPVVSKPIINGHASRN